MRKVKNFLLKLHTISYYLSIAILILTFSVLIAALQGYWVTDSLKYIELIIEDLIIPLVIIFFIVFIFIIFIKYLQRDITALKNKNIEIEKQLNFQNDFFASMSHEIRTPMNAIKSMSQILVEDRGLAKRQSQAAITINNSSNMLLGIVNDILDFSKIKAGKLVFENISFEFNMILNYIVDTLGLQVKEKGLDLIFDIDNNVCKNFLGDPLRVSQILLNLISNAVKFTDTGSITLSIKSIESKKDSSLLEIEVRDTGIGIKEDRLNALFQNFSQADEATSRKYGGTGLGLSIAKQLASMMHGKIWVESVYGEGTSFFVQIELQTDPEDARRKYRLPSTDIMQKRVLIVETQEKSAQALQKLLNYFHISSDIALNPIEAEEYLHNEQFNVLCIDEHLHHQCTEKKIGIEQISKKIILEDWMDSLHRNDFNNTNECHYLKRPFNLQMLFETLSTLYSHEDTSKILKNNYTKKHLSQLGHHKILVAEDNLINQKVIHSLLLDTDIEAVSLSNGQELMDELNNSEYDYKIIFMDIHMPVLNGHETALKIRENTKYDNVKIIALSGDTSAEDIQKSLNSGMQEHIEKPINIKMFYEILIKTLDNKLSA